MRLVFLSRCFHFAPSVSHSFSDSTLFHLATTGHHPLSSIALVAVGPNDMIPFLNPCYSACYLHDSYDAILKSCLHFTHVADHLHSSHLHVLYDRPILVLLWFHSALLVDVFIFGGTSGIIRETPYRLRIPNHTASCN